MAIFEIIYPTSFEESSCYLKRNDLSIQAKGLLHMLFDLESEWDGSLDDLYEKCQEEIEEVGLIMRELIDKGYIVPKVIFGRGLQARYIELKVTVAPQEESFEDDITDELETIFF